MATAAKGCSAAKLLQQHGTAVLSVDVRMPAQRGWGGKTTKTKRGETQRMTPSCLKLILQCNGRVLA